MPSLRFNVSGFNVSGFLIWRFFALAMRRCAAHGLAVFWAALACVALVVSAGAQQNGEEKPFIEPAEHGRQHVQALVESQPQQHGKWDTLPFEMPINPVHVAMMHNGKVLVISGSGNDPNNKRFEAAVWYPREETVQTFPIKWDMFCNGMVILPDGMPFVLGGTQAYDPFFGEPRTAMFNPATAQFTDGKPMNGGRWYPTGTVLGDGFVLVISGLNDRAHGGSVNRSVQIWNGTAWTDGGTASFSNLPLYPREHLLPDGKVFEDGANPTSQFYNRATKTWTAGPTTIFGQNRDYGTSVLLPLLPANEYRPKVIIMGGGPGAQNVTNTTETIDLSAPNPRWAQGPPMAHPRIQLNATILPSGQVLVSGGSAIDEDGASASLEAQIYDPAANSFSSAGNMAFPRLYHSNTLLLPDATVLAVGGNPERTVYEPHIEIYSPPYLFRADGQPAPRPQITGAVPAEIRYGAPFQVRTPQSADIKSVVLIRAGAVTHAFDMEQRMVGLTFTAGAGVLDLKAPPKGDIAPPGYYLLFIVNREGVPSVGQFVHLAAR